MDSGKPFIVSDDYLDWAHSSAADDGQPLAVKLFEQPIRRKSRVINDPLLVAEVADVAGLYVGGRDSNLRAAKVSARALEWLRERGMTVRQLLPLNA